MFDWFKKKKPADGEAKLPPVPETTDTPPGVEVSPPSLPAPPATAVLDALTSPEPITQDPEPDSQDGAEIADIVADPEHSGGAPGSDSISRPAAPEGNLEEPRKGWFARMREGLSKSTSRLTDGISGIFTKRKLDDEALEELEELLIQADLGPTTAARITAGLAKARFGKEISPQEVREYLAEEVAKIVTPIAQPLTVDPSHAPHVVLVVGVNGTGKTTTIGKLAQQLREEGKTVWLAAGDTFRAAAVSQLQIWGERTGAPVVTRESGADPAGLVYEALERARAAKADVLLIDTAGRLQNKQGLMDELRKIVRVLKKLDPTAPHTTLLTLDATTGQNAHSQVEIFKDMVAVNGLILTKLDGSARGGVLVALAEKFGLPVHAIGVGEGVQDMRPFDARGFARALVGLGD